MAQETANQAHELALAVLEQAQREGTLFEAHQARLTELTSAGVNVRTDVEDALESTAEPADSAEPVKELELETQYGERLNTLKHYGFLDEQGEAKEGDIKAPTYEEAMATLKPEELEIASRFQKPTLLLIPETSFAAKVKAMDAHKQGLQENDTYVNEIYGKTDSGSDKITGWRVVIVDGAQEMEVYDGDKLDLRFDKRIEARKGARKEGEKGMDRHRYALLMMEAIRNGDPVDKELCTSLDDDPALSDSYAPSASFVPDLRRVVSFTWDDPVDLCGDVRFRSSVGGDVLLS